MSEQLRAKLVHQVDRRKEWFEKVRLRSLGIIAAGFVGAFALVSWMALPAIPVIGVALITVAALVNGVTAKVDDAVCRGCGTKLPDKAPGVYGVFCETCGLVNPQVPPQRKA